MVGYIGKRPKDEEEDQIGGSAILFGVGPVILEILAVLVEISACIYLAKLKRYDSIDSRLQTDARERIKGDQNVVRYNPDELKTRRIMVVPNMGLAYPEDMDWAWGRFHDSLTAAQSVADFTDHLKRLGKIMFWIGLANSYYLMGTLVCVAKDPLRYQDAAPLSISLVMANVTALYAAFSATKGGPDEYL